MIWVWLAVAGQALWAVVDLLDKVIRERHIRDSLVMSVTMGLAALPTALGIGVFRGFDEISPATGLLVLGGALAPIAFLFYYRAIAVEEASRVIPLFQATPIWTLGLSVAFLGDRLGLEAYAGFLLILCGGALVSIEPGAGGLRLSPALSLMLICTFIYAVSQVVVKASLGALDVTFDFVDATKWQALGYGLAASGFLLAPTVRQRFARAWRAATPQGLGLLGINQLLVATAARTLMLGATATGPVALVTVMTAFQSAFVLLLAVLITAVAPGFLYEDVRGRALVIKSVAVVFLIAGLGVLNAPVLLPSAVAPR